MAINPKDIVWDDNQPDIVWDDEPQHPISTQYAGGKPTPTISQDRSLLSAKTKATISDIARPVLEYGGAGVGAALGTAGGVLGGPPGMAASGLVGGTIGYAGGKAAANILDTALGVPREELVKRATSPTPIKETVSQTFNDLKYGAEMELTGGIGGKAITAMTGKLISPLSKKTISPFTGEASREIPKETQELIKLYKEAGISPSPAELVHGGKTLAIVESVLGYSPLSGDVILKKNLTKLNSLMTKRAELIGKDAPAKIIEAVGNDIRKEARGMITKYGTKQAEKVDALVNDFMGKYGSMSKYQSGLKFGEIMNADREARAGQVKELYDAVKQSLPGKGQDVIPLSRDISNTAEELLRAEISKAKSIQDSGLINLLNDFIPPKGTALPEGLNPAILAKNPQLQAMINPQRTMTWEGIDQTRSTLLEKIRAIHKTQGEATKESRVYSILADKLDDEMSKYASQMGGGTANLIAQARATTKTMHEIYDKDVLRIMNKPPEDILKKIVNNGEVTLLNQIRQATGDKGLEPLRQGFFKQAIESSTMNGVLNPVKLQKVLKAMGDESLNTLATPEQLGMLRNIVSKSVSIDTRMGKMKTIDFLETLAGTSNEKVVDAIFKTNNVSNIKLAKRILSPERMKEVTSKILEKKIFPVSGSGTHLPVSSAKEFFKHEAELKALLSPEQFTATKNFVKLGQRMSNVEALAKNSSQTGQVFVGSDALKLLLRAPLAAVKMTVVPWALAHAYTSPMALKYMTSAAKLPPNSPEAINMFIKGWGIAYKEKQNQIMRDLQTIGGEEE